MEFDEQPIIHKCVETIYQPPKSKDMEKTQFNKIIKGVVSRNGYEREQILFNSSINIG